MISIIIPTMQNNIEYLKFCINSIKKYSKEEHEIIVVSNPDPYYEIPIDGIKRLHSTKQGQCVSVNMGVKEAKNEYVLISDDDVVFPPNWEKLIEKAKEIDFLSGNFMESGIKGGVAAPFVTQDLGNSPKEFDCEMFEVGSLFLNEDKFENGFGFPLICKKELWEKIGGYDEEYDPWGSNCDSDLEYKIMLAGIMPKRYRGVLTYHFAQVSRIFDHGDYWQKNRRYFEQKWGIARANPPEIWFCNLKIDKNNLRYKPEWAKLENNENIV
jgi:glycosyltransferase involved in cell wall biosynthesis